MQSSLHTRGDFAIFFPICPYIYMYSRTSDFTRCYLTTSWVWGTETLVCLCIIVLMQIVDFSTPLTIVFSGYSIHHFQFLACLEMLYMWPSRAELGGCQLRTLLGGQELFWSIQWNDRINTTHSPRPGRLACRRHGAPRVSAMMPDATLDFGNT